MDRLAGSFRLIYMSRRGAWVLILILSIAAAACSSDDTFLPALLADPMADHKGEGIVLVDAWEQADHPGFLGSKPLHAMVELVYRIEDQSEAQRILNEAVAFAESVGWRVQRESPREYRGAKELVPGAGRIHLSIPAEDVLHDPDGPRVLRIHLDFGPVRFDDTTTSTGEGG